MAEFGAHLTTTSSELPSIFEVLAQENLSSTLGPAFGHLVKVIAQIDPSHFERLWKWHQEIFVSVELILQHYCLKSCGASFAENFYGLKRSPLGSEKSLSYWSNYALPIQHHRKALACLVLVPYIRLKLSTLYETLTENEEGQNTSNNNWLKVKSVFLKIYPLIHLSWELSVLIYQVNYALGKTTFSSPLYRFASTQLITLTNDDDTEQPLLKLWNEIQNSSSLMAIPFTVISHVYSNTRELFTSALSIATFFLQYIEWWHSNKSSDNPLISIISFPNKDAVPLNVPKGRVCPICLLNRTNDTVLIISGYIFCYPCIYRYIKRYGSCPITKLPTNEENLVRLYLNN